MITGRQRSTLMWRMTNKALMAMPKYSGSGLTRNTQLSKEQQAAYLSDHIVQEKAFMSTSTKSVFSGNTVFKVTAIGKRGADVDKISVNSGEKEVLFVARTYFILVHKRRRHWE